MNCPTFAQLAAHAEGESPPAIRTHVAGCSDCGAIVELLRNLSALPAPEEEALDLPCPSRQEWERFVRAADGADASVRHLATCDRCLQTVAAVQQPSRPARAVRKLRRRSRVWPAVAGIAAAFTMIVGGWWLTMKSPTPPSIEARKGPDERLLAAPDPAPPPARVTREPAPSPRQDDEQRKIRIEGQMRREIEKARAAFRQPAPPAPPAAPEPEPPPPPKVARPAFRPTLAAVARVESAAGSFSVTGPRAGGLVRVGQNILPGQGISTGSRGRVTLVYPDGSRITLRPESSLANLYGRTPRPHLPGKRLTLERGELLADIVAQPASQPLRIRTPNGELTVLGTSFRVSAAPDSTRLAVREGRVRLSRNSDGATVEVDGGHHANAAEGTDLRARPTRTVWTRGFESLEGIHQGTHARVREGEGMTSAVVSIPISSTTWDADGKIGIRNGGRPIFTIPKRPAFRLRIRSERAGKIEFQLIVDPDNSKQSYELKDRLDVGPEWREIVLTPEDFFLWLDKSPMRPGTPIPGLNLYTFGAGTLYVDRIDVVSTARE